MKFIRTPTGRWINPAHIRDFHIDRIYFEVIAVYSPSESITIARFKSEAEAEDWLSKFVAQINKTC